MFSNINNTINGKGRYQTKTKSEREEKRREGKRRERKTT